MSIFTIKTDKLADVIKNVLALQKKAVYVGVPEATTQREDEPINNATIAYIQDNGSPAANIPARPFLREGVERDIGKIEKRLRKAADSALDGKDTGPELAAAGLIGQNAVRDYMTTADFIPLSDATLKNRARRQGGGVRINKGAQAELDARARGEAPSNNNTRPLIDTGELRKSITYVVRGE